VFASMLPSMRLKRPLRPLQLGSLAPMKYARNGVLFATARFSPFAMCSEYPEAATSSKQTDLWMVRKWLREINNSRIVRELTANLQS
jgi:hypothetical protein